MYWQKLFFKNYFAVTANSKTIMLILATIPVLFLGCKKFLEIQPPATKVSAESVYNNDATAAAVLTGVYSRLSLANYNSTATVTNLSLWTGLTADEFVLWSGGSNIQKTYYRNSLSTSAGGVEFWNNTFPMIFTCNSAIEGLEEKNSLTPTVKQQLLGEAKFLRAYLYFYLTNLYGDVPLVINTDYTQSATTYRASKDEVYEQIISDLVHATELLNDLYMKGDAKTPYPNNAIAERVRPNKTTALALLSRVYLFKRDFTNAEITSTKVIANSDYRLLSLSEVFLKNSYEAIWQLQPVTTGTITNTADAVTYNLSFAPTGLNSTHPVSLSKFLIQSFDSADLRKSNWIKSHTDQTGTNYYPTKYKANPTGTVTPTEYYTLFRLAEQYLVRAEARLHLNNTRGSVEDINVIKKRAGLMDYQYSNKKSLADEILKERQRELFVECGHRWLDLKRTEAINNIMTTVCQEKGGSWTENWALFPIPLQDIEKNQNLHQNPGY